VDERELAGYVGTNVIYAIFVFLGTNKQAPQPALQQSLEMNKGFARRQFKAG
jgi:hypothetical protein